MKALYVSLIVLALGVSVAHADCGSAHGKKDPHNMGRISNTHFKDMDTDNSGTLSMDEFKAVFPRTSDAGFKMLDKDGNNSLSPDEWQAFKDAHKSMGGYTHAPETT